MMDKVKADLKEEICVIIRGKIAQVVATAIITVKSSKISAVATKKISIDSDCAKTFLND